MAAVKPGPASRKITGLPWRVLRKLERDENGCWVWHGALDRGYGRMRVDGRGVSVHRLAYEMFVGPLPKSLVIDHLCRNRACANPAHMELVTIGENARRGAGYAGVLGKAGQQARQTHCLRGHPLSGDNLRIAPDGRRKCRECARIRGRVYDARRRKKAA